MQIFLTVEKMRVVGFDTDRMDHCVFQIFFDEMDMLLQHAPYFFSRDFRPIENGIDLGREKSFFGKIDPIANGYSLLL